jgi:ribonuclease III
LSGEELAQIIGYEFARRELLEEALTHPSLLGSGHPTRRSYDRLEFLGDRVLGLIIADLLWRRFADETEGHLTRRYHSLVRREALARVAETIGLGRHLAAARAEAAAGAAGSPGILADACEALIAAVYLDGGFAAAAAFVRRFWWPLMEEMEGPPHDPKTALQEWAQARRLGLPAYEVVATSGPNHALVFTVAARVAGHEEASATAPSKRMAEARAAAILLDRLAGETKMPARRHRRRSRIGKSRTIL